MKRLALVALAATIFAGCGDRASELDRLMQSESSLVRLQRQLDWTVTAADGGEALATEQAEWRKQLQGCLDAEDPALCVAEAHQERLADLQQRYGLDPRSVAVDAAGRMGFEFRAVGNEPGWNLLVSRQRLVWETDYGRTRHEVETTAADADGESRTYRARVEGEDLVIHVDPGPCADDMSGEEFAWTVLLEYAGETFRGCADRTGS